MLLDPFNLLGVTMHSTCQEVRKRYYGLACICHPDRGGTNEQMQMLHNAYRYVMDQVSLNRSVAFEELEQEFKDFCDAQTSAPPEFRSIYADAFNLPEFNDLFVASSSHVDSAFCEGGYETVPSVVQPDAYDGTPDTDFVPPFETQVIEYQEPQARIMPFQSLRDVNGVPLDNFSCRVGALSPADYREGLSAPASFSTHAGFEELSVLGLFDSELSVRGLSS